MKALFITTIIFFSIFSIPESIGTLSNTLSIYYIDVEQPGWYYLPLSINLIDIIDVYGNPINVYIVKSDWFINGYVFYIPSSGRYYVIIGTEPTRKNTLSTNIFNINVTYTYDHRWGGYTVFHEVLNNTQIHSFTSANNIVYIKYRLTTQDFLLVGGKYGTAKFLMTRIYAINETYIYVSYNASWSSISYGFNTDVVIIVSVDNQIVYEKKIYDFRSGSITIKVTKGYHTIEMYASSTTDEKWAKKFTITVELNGTYIVGNITFPQQISIKQFTYNVNVERSINTVTVYAHNITIELDSEPVLKYIVVPVDTTEIRQLVVQINPVVYDPLIDTILPARLFKINNTEFIVFQAWSNTTKYTIIWNYPLSHTISYSNMKVFIDEFKTDPLLHWSVVSNASRIEYSKENRALMVYGDNFTFILTKKLDFNASAILTCIRTERGFVGFYTNTSIPLFNNLDGIIVFNYDTLYKIRIVDNIDMIRMNFSKIAKIIEYSSDTVLIYASDKKQSFISGVAVMETMPIYNVTFQKQLLRIKMNIERYEIRYNLPQSIGYWKYLIQCTIYYDPAYIPPNIDYFNVWIELPEEQWISQGYAKPGLVDIAVTNSEGKLLDFYIEPYRLPNGNRRIWVKLPADPTRNFYVVNILLGNDIITSSLSTPNAFITYYSELNGVGSSWKIDKYGFIVTNNIYVNTIYVEPKKIPVFKIGMTVDDFYNISFHGITEVHSMYSEQIVSFTGMITLQQSHYITWTISGKLQYWQGNILVWEQTGLDKPWTFPPSIVGAKNAKFIGLAILVPFSYSLGTITGGKWNPDIRYENENTVIQSDWNVVGKMIIALIPLILISLAIRLASNPPSIVVSRQRGLL